MIEKGIAVIGSTTIDKIIHRNRSWLKTGGATIYSGITYSRHGIKTLAITNISDRNPEIMERLQKEKIRVCNGQSKHTTHFTNYVYTEDCRQQNPCRAASITRKQIWDHVKDVGLVHLGPLHPADIDRQALKSFQKLDLDVILDIQGLVRKVKSGNVYAAASQQLSDALSVSQIVKANRHEYAVMVDFFQTDLATLMRQFNIREFVVTSGANGGFIKQSTAEAIPYSAAVARSRGDPTGAGDIFLAAYVVGRFLKRHSIPDACNYAAKLAARQIEGNYIKKDDLCLDS